jgi:predicted nucleic acid-binding protein
MNAYADTSVLLSWHTADSRFDEALRLVAASAPLLFTPWQRVEFGNAARALAFQGVLSPKALHRAAASVLKAQQTGDLVPHPLPAYALWQEAERLSIAHTRKIGVRTLDLLHVAAARVLGAAEILTFDRRQTALAQAAGLTVRGPFA